MKYVHSLFSLVLLVFLLSKFSWFMWFTLSMSFRVLHLSAKRAWYHGCILCLTNYAHVRISVLANFGGTGKIIRLSQWQWTILKKWTCVLHEPTKSWWHNHNKTQNKNGGKFVEIYCISGILLPLPRVLPLVCETVMKYWRRYKSLGYTTYIGWSMMYGRYIYCQTSNISRTLVKIKLLITQMYLEQRLSAICYKSTSTALGKQPWKIWVNKLNTVKSLI